MGGSARVHKNKLKAGQIVSFRYSTPDKKQRGTRKLPRMVFVLNRRNTGNGIMVHGINLETVPYGQLVRFLRGVIIKDTLIMLKRRYELRGPFSQLIDQPKSFYTTYIKPNLLEYECYRTYRPRYMTDVKVWMMDWKKLFSYTDKQDKGTLITKQDTLKDILVEGQILNKLTDSTDITKLVDVNFRKLIEDRFGSVTKFFEIAEDIDLYVKKDPTDQGRFTRDSEKGTPSRDTTK